jgi:hypothetical protein
MMPTLYRFEAVAALAWQGDDGGSRQSPACGTRNDRKLRQMPRKQQILGEMAHLVRVECPNHTLQAESGGVLRHRWSGFFSEFYRKTA